MLVCELDRNWNVRDVYHQKPDYSLLELDIFSHTRGKANPDFRLSVRKNIETGQFELYRDYHSSAEEEVVLKGSFKNVIDAANEQWSHWWNDDKPIVIDEACTHDKSKELAHGCPLSCPHAYLLKNMTGKVWEVDCSITEKECTGFSYNPLSPWYGCPQER